MNPIHATLFNLIYLGWKKPSWKGFSKLNKNFLRNYLETFWIFSGFWGGFFFIFLEELFWRIFLGGFFWEDLFGRIFLRGFFGEDFSGRNSLFILLKSVNLFESERKWCFCQDFVSIKKEGQEFRPLEVRCKLIHSSSHLKRLNFEFLNW